MSEETREEVERLRGMLEQELDRGLHRQRGCWPLLVAAVGVLLGVALLFGRIL
jgi:hypothetical protein